MVHNVAEGGFRERTLASIDSPTMRRDGANMPGTPILIIDDEPGILDGLREFLEDEGYEVHQALEGKEAVEAFRTVSPDLVMADLCIPGMSGIEIIGEIRKLNEYTPVIVVTGYGSFNSAIDAIRLNVFDYITKPIDLECLKDILDRAKARLRSAQEIQKEIVLPPRTGCAVPGSMERPVCPVSRKLNR